MHSGRNAWNLQLIVFELTVWKLQNFSITQILRKIKDDESKSAILIKLEALNCNFYKFLHFLKPQIYQIQSPGNCENGNFRISRVSKIDFT